MKLNIGENIKRMRREREITQEEFAEILGVSCQSVSRWEKGICYPDIELIPTIAAFFGISADKLMGIDESAEKSAVDRYLSDFRAAVSMGNIDECIRIARMGVAEFPNNYTLLNKLMYALFLSGSDDADIPDWEENKKKYDAEIIAIGERIIKYCNDTETKYEATERLAFHHCEMGRRDMGRSIYETLPSITYCRESGIWWALSEEEKLSHTRMYIHRAYYILFDAIYRLKGLLPFEDSVRVIDKLKALDELIYDGKGANLTWSAARLPFYRATYLIKSNRFDEAIEELKVSAEMAIAFDNRPDEIKVSSLLLGESTRSKNDFETADSRPLREILRDSWLSDKSFDPIRNRKEFKEIVERLA